jgi:hypothetical protein
MEKQEMMDRAEKALTPFETENIVKFIKHMSTQTFIDNPWLIVVFLVVFFYAIVKRSKFVLLFLFSFFAIMLLIRYTLPSDGELSVKSLFPLAAGGVAIGSVIIYFAFIRTD